VERAGLIDAAFNLARPSKNKPNQFVISIN